MRIVKTMGIPAIRCGVVRLTGRGWNWFNRHPKGRKR